jgi:HSP90 family molecular chaperone
VVANKEKIAKLLRFATNKSADATQTATLECYVKSMQKESESFNLLPYVEWDRFVTLTEAQAE